MHTAFNIKPDIVIETDGVPVVCIEAKLESGLSRYDLGDFKIDQLEMQHLLFMKLLRCNPCMVLISQRAEIGKDSRTITWAEAFKCFTKYRGEEWIESAIRRVETLNREKRPTERSDTMPQQDGQFPSHDDLRKEVEIYELLQPFLIEKGEVPRRNNATIGISYIKGEKGQPHENSLYRIRTTRKYYTSIEQKRANLPKGFIELELWPDVIEKIQPGFSAWLKLKGIQEPAEGRHIDKAGNIKVWILQIRRPLERRDVDEMNQLLRKGFSLLARQA